MKVTDAKVEANRRNAQKSTGPKNTERTKMNAAKFELMVQGITELDEFFGFPATLARLRREFKPVGEIEELLVWRLAIISLRLRRGATLEAEFITSELGRPKIQRAMQQREVEQATGEDGERIDWGWQPRMEVAEVGHLTDTFQRYETAVENKLFRTLHELERLQRMRQGELLPAPAAVEVNVHEGADDEIPAVAMRNGGGGRNSKTVRA
ncbi:MAG: hypothetical protein ABSD20_07045 [Terriglobales bacterium]|jgi:hypothetical protein